MNKPIKKKWTYNTQAVNALIEKHGFSRFFIQASIRGDRTSFSAEKIRKEYADLIRPTQKKIDKFKKQ